MAKSGRGFAVLAAFALGSLCFVGYQPAARSAENRVAMRGAAVEWDPKLSRDVVEVRGGQSLFKQTYPGHLKRGIKRERVVVGPVFFRTSKSLSFEKRKPTKTNLHDPE